MTPTCGTFEPLIDLLAGGELAGGELAATRAHLAACPRCRCLLDEARSLQGLLDVHFQQPASLARLRLAVRREAGPGRRALRFVRRLAPLAALVLVAVGLAWLLPSPSPDAAPAPADLAFATPAPVRGHAAPAIPELALGKDVAQGLKALRAPLTVTLHNPSDGALQVALGGPDFALRMALCGPRVDRDPAPAIAPPLLSPRTVILPPRGHLDLTLSRLADQRGLEVFALTPSTPGDYRLTVEVRARAWPAGFPRLARRLVWRAGPTALRLTWPAPVAP